MPPACLRTAETPLHAAPFVSVLYGAPFTHSQQPRVVAHRTFGTETAQGLAPVASCLRGRLTRATSSPWAEVFSTRGASDFSEPSVPKHSRPCLRHRRPAPLRWAAPAQQNAHNSSNISVFVKPALQEIPRVAEAAREPKPSS
jgi:hypothetical protein